MKKHIFKTFIDENFKKAKDFEFNGISLIYGAPGSGKTFFLNELVSNEKSQLLYIGRNFEKYSYFNVLISVDLDKLNKSKMFLGSEDEDIDFIKLEANLEKLIIHGYKIIFDEVFWENSEYYKMIERLIISNKFDSDIIVVMRHIDDNMSFKYERIAKNLSQVILFKNDIIGSQKNIGDFAVFKREIKKELTTKEVEAFHKN